MNILVAIPLTFGLISTLLLLLRAATFIQTYTRASSLPRYQRPSSWALVTGSTDGIGRALAFELANRGFNVLLHGRNSSRLSALASSLSTSFPGQSFKILVLDVTSTSSPLPEQIAKLASSISELKLTALVNNLGGTPSTVADQWCKPFAANTPGEIEDILKMNLTFTTQLTGALLPQLMANQPSLVLTVGGMGEKGIPWLGVYSGSKAFLMSWTRSLRREMFADKKDVEVLGVMTSEVTQTSTDSRPPSLFVPSATTYARAVLDRVGSSQAVVTGYWSHSILIGIVECLPDFIITSMLIDAMRKKKVQNTKDS